MGHHPRGGGYFGGRGLALLESNREAGLVRNFFVSINFEVISYSEAQEELSSEGKLLRDNGGSHSLLRAAAVRAPQALEVHFLRETRILST